MPEPWYVCRCKRKLYEHRQRTVPSTGGRELVCTRTQTGRFEPADPRLQYDPEHGLREREPERVRGMLPDHEPLPY